MADEKGDRSIGVLLSGGLDSTILLYHLLEQERTVYPFYVRSRLHWEWRELDAVREIVRSAGKSNVRDLVLLDLPLQDLYQDHWSVTGESVPDGATEDKAVFLPGRNALLVIKAAIWCQLHGVPQLALAPLQSNPFADASPKFFQHLQAALNFGATRVVEIVRPFESLSKREVLALGKRAPLALTFSCLAPVGRSHCGRCNKCAERRAAFAMAGLDDPTVYDKD